MFYQRRFMGIRLQNSVFDVLRFDILFDTQNADSQ